METNIRQQNLGNYRRLIAESQVAMRKHRIRHNELLRLLLEEDAKGQIEPPVQEIEL